MKKGIQIIFSLLILQFFVSETFSQRDEWNQLDPTNSPSARKGHSMATLPDGVIVMFGGEGTQADLFNDLYIFRENDWEEEEPVNDPPPPRSYHKAWLFGEEMYVFGGKGEETVYNDLWVYNTTTKSWAELASGDPKPAGRYGHSVNVMPDGSVFIFGGHDGEDYFFKDAWIYNDDGFTQLSDALTIYGFHNGLVNNNNGVLQLLFFGRLNLISTYFYDTDLWDLEGGDIPYFGHGSSITSQNYLGEDVIFIFGGNDADENPTDIVYEYNAASGELIQRQDPLPGAVKDNAAAKYYYGNFSGREDMYEVLLFGGEVDGELSNATWMSTSNLLSEDEVFPKDDFELEFGPNPVYENLYIKSSLEIQQVYIYDINGKLLDCLEVNSREFVLQDQLPAIGIYIVGLKSQNQVYYRKLLVNK